MNAAARIVHHGVFTRHLALKHFFTRQQLTVFLFGIAVLLSALSIIYVTHVTRIFYAEYQQNVLAQNHLRVERGKLLLERSTWMMQARVQQIAENQLGMVVPGNHSVIVIRE